MRHLSGGVILVLVLSIASMSCGADLVCDKSLLVNLQDNDDLTHLQRMHAASQCEGKKVVVRGSVEDVGSFSNIRLISTDGLNYEFRLSEEHRCGDLVQIKKRQGLTLEGTVAHAYPHIPKYVIENAACVR